MDFGKRVIQEGQAKIEIEGDQAFYSEPQVASRDLSVALLRWFCRLRREEAAAGVKFRRWRRGMRGPHSRDRPEDLEGLYLLEGLAASGIRALRYALEVPDLGRIDACDVDSRTIATLNANIALNGDAAASKVTAVHDDVVHLLAGSEGLYDVIDVDPYGSPVAYLEPAVRAAADGALLMVTATDMAVLAGGQPAVSWRKYRSVSARAAYHDEQAIRILLSALDSAAARHKRAIEPLLCVHVDYWVRLFVRVRHDAQAAKLSLLRNGMVWKARGCGSFYIQPLGSQTKSGEVWPDGRGPVVPQRCPDSGSSMVLSGPMWLGPLHSPAAVAGALAELDAGLGDSPCHAKLKGLLTLCQQELPDAPLYFQLDDLCSSLKVSVPPRQLVTSAIVNAGYRMSSSHCSPSAIKTNAPFDFIWDVLRTWSQEHPPKTVSPGPQQVLLSKEITHTVSFARIEPKSDDRAGCYPPNPKNWGPQKRNRPVRVNTPACLPRQRLPAVRPWG